MEKILIVEDQKWPLRALESAVQKIGPKYLPEMNYDVARCFNDARKMIQGGYDIVLLDHMMPLENITDLEETNFEKFTSSLESIGYSLINEIKGVNAKTIIVGTSSLSELELSDSPNPDYIISKKRQNVEGDLNKIFAEIFL